MGKASFKHSIPTTIRLPTSIAKAVREKEVHVSAICQNALLKALRPHSSKTEMLYFEEKMHEMQEYHLAGKRRRKRVSTK